MQHERIIEKVRALFSADFSGHDFYHTFRVYKIAMKLCEAEGADKDTVALASLLHDADDVKLFKTENYANARAIMRDEGISDEKAQRVVDIISKVSFKGTDTEVPESLEGKIVQDADRIDALGAIGIARTFAYGGSHGRAMYDPDEPPTLGMDEQSYRAKNSSSLNHFYEKLFLLKDMMNTPAAKAIAAERTKLMEDFVQAFLNEWNGI